MTQSGVQTEAREPHGTGGFAAWAGDVARACELVAALVPLAAELGLPDAAASDWHGALFGKLRPQVDREPVLVAAVCGGTNTGKSLITNSLVGAEISRSLPEAARTVHPVASLPRGLAARIDLAGLFPGFRPIAWTSEEDALDTSRPDLLVWREDATGGQPQRLVLLDTPDIDGTLRENWHRAELVRNAADVLVAVLTQQKYNDAAVREFFAAAAAAGKTVLVVFNMLDWPRQRDRLAGWLATFTAETGLAPAAVYAVPHDFAAAEAGRIVFHALPELTPDGRDLPPVERLATSDFDALKLRSMRGAMAVVLEPRHGLPRWLDAIATRAGEWKASLGVLEREGQVRVALPPAPRELVWQEIWNWLEPRRSRLDLVVSRGYRAVGEGLAKVGRTVGLLRTPEEQREDFQAVELKALKQALGDFVQRLDDACGRDPRLASLLGPRLASPDRTAWFDDLERRHAALPLVSEGYRSFVRSELDRFAAENPALVKFIVGGLSAGAVARPVVTLALFGAGAAMVPAAAGAAGGLSVLVHHVGDYAVWAAAPLVGEGVIGLAAAGVRQLIERLFAGWAAQRGRILIDTLHDVVLGDGVEEVGRLAAAAARPELAQLRQLIVTLGRETAA
ncbi:MAG: GTPase domain-containing protein [Planctomycetota bacterium]